MPGSIGVDCLKVLETYWSKIIIDTEVVLKVLKTDFIPDELFFDEKFKAYFLNTAFNRYVIFWGIIQAFRLLIILKFIDPILVFAVITESQYLMRICSDS